jgi:hypothetical protein
MGVNGRARVDSRTEAPASHPAFASLLALSHPLPTMRCSALLQPAAQRGARPAAAAPARARPAAPSLARRPSRGPAPVRFKEGEDKEVDPLEKLKQVVRGGRVSGDAVVMRSDHASPASPPRHLLLLS